MFTAPASRPPVSPKETTLPQKSIILLLTPALLVVVTLFGGGLVIGFFQALGYQPGIEEQSLSLQHFITTLTDPDFTTSLGLTLYIALTSTLISAIASILLAVAINHWAANNKIIHFILQIPLAAPHLVIGISMILLIAPSGFIARLCSFLFAVDVQNTFPILVNDKWSVGILLVYIWKEIPFITFMLLTVLKNMGNELLEAGASLGATKLQRFFSITFPIIRLSLGASCCIVFAFTFGAFEIPYLLGQTYPQTLPVWAYMNFSDIDLKARPEGVALGIIIAVIVISTVLLSEYLTRTPNRNR
ncbi:ABC transporter permease [Desulforhopalus sp. IMCC35007]|uniref:ABC transporter permease n=1 Tax=Desulforhopalus sp. IMCC35007 TaxID=2569543 RepID=UPI0010AE927A|nr:ABC transporter permease subunit [Desulforhopalus sp. IMCC35007]TKB08633.1 ABC transporter permease subunit [Desulforhopalus sp. IMCC35007]